VSEVRGRVAFVGVGDLTSREAVLEAIAEFDRLGRETFLAKHGFGPARDFHLVHEGTSYPSKAIAGVAHGYQHPTRGPLSSDEFTGGRKTVGRRLKALGFDVESDSAARASDEAPPWHLLMRWDRERNPETIELHRKVVTSEDAVWWGKLGSPSGARAISTSWMERFQAQLDADVPTYFFLYSPGESESWRTTLEAISYERPGEEAHLIPEYYRNELKQHHLWLKVKNFKPLEADHPHRNLIVHQDPDPHRMEHPLRGQRALIYVQERNAVPSQEHPSTWWVNQGKNSAEEREQGRLWAPLKDNGGRSLRHWLDLTKAREDDLVLHYWNGAVQAVGRVDEDPVEASYPGGNSSDRLGNLLGVEYTDLQEPVPLSSIPAEWRLEEGEPFNSSGGVRQGYFYPLSEQFFRRMAERFPEIAAFINLAAERGPRGRSLDAEAVNRAAELEGLRLDSSIYSSVVAALRSGKHVILTGPPGTAKTTLAQVLAKTAAAAGLCDGYLLSTATADWTTYETIGGLRPQPDSTLEFEPGHFLSAIEQNQWLVIDELNRSNFDRAFGQLFTTLSGQSVVLPYTRAGQSGRLTLVPDGAEPPSADTDVLPIPETWRIIATMNVFDKSLLFEMSYALMRRFAFIEVPAPEDSVFRDLIDGWAGGDEEAADMAKALLDLRSIKDIGPAVYRDIARYARERRGIGSSPHGQLAFECFYSYLLPQFEGIDDETGDALYKRLRPMVGTALRVKLRRTLKTVLGVELVKAAPSLEEDAETDEGDEGLDVEVEVEDDGLNAE
jgi:MoxR-like ATPase